MKNNLIMQTDNVFSNNIWECYLHSIKGILKNRDNSDIADQFHKNQYFSGKLPTEIATDLAESFANGPTEKFGVMPTLPTTLISVLSDKMISEINTYHHYHRITAGQRWKIQDILEMLAEPVAANLGTPWRVLNCRAWSTPASDAVGAGPNDWHTDAEPLGVYKIMIYLTAIGGDQGGIDLRDASDHELRLVEEPGCWVLFYNSHLLHRGYAPTAPTACRRAIEVTICHWLTMQLEPVFLGQNGRHPITPL
jgi:hypothetical protein